jgi:hypothetical protein
MSVPRRWVEQRVWDAMLTTLVDLGLTNDWQHMIDGTIVRGQSQAAGAKGEPMSRALAEVPPALRARSTPAVTVRDVLSASFKQAAKCRITGPCQRR